MPHEVAGTLPGRVRPTAAGSLMMAGGVNSGDADKPGFPDKG